MITFLFVTSQNLSNIKWTFSNKPLDQKIIMINRKINSRKIVWHLVYTHIRGKSLVFNSNYPLVALACVCETHSYLYLVKPIFTS